MQKNMGARLAELDPAEIAYRALAAFGVIAVVVTAVAVVESYSNLLAFVQAHNLHDWRAVIAPAAVDTFIIMGEVLLFAALLLAWSGKAVYAFAYGMTVWGFLLSVGGNVWHVPSASVIDKSLGAIWPVTATAGLAGCLIIVRRLIDDRRSRLADGPDGLVTEHFHPWNAPEPQLFADEPPLWRFLDDRPSAEFLATAWHGQSQTPPDDAGQKEPESVNEPVPAGQPQEQPPAGPEQREPPQATLEREARPASLPAAQDAAPRSGRKVDPARAAAEDTVVLDLISRPRAEWPTVGALAQQLGSVRSARRAYTTARAMSNGAGDGARH